MEGYWGVVGRLFGCSCDVVGTLFGCSVMLLGCSLGVV